MGRKTPSNTPATHKHLTFNNDCTGCRALQTEWYEQLAQSGFQDIEARKRDDGTIDVENTPQTEPSGVVSYDSRSSRNPNDPDNLADHENLALFGEPTTVWNTPAALDLQFLEDEIDDLPPAYLHREFLAAYVAAGCTNLTPIAKAHGLTRWQGRTAKSKFFSRLRKLGRLS